ncbi:MAG: DEAD/DEAH box helicase family protein [Bacteroidales bacterium]|nr:DEAD/DEAH box helicase family protein [Bacteroidales bacterium]
MDDATIHNLKEEIFYLRSLLDKNGIEYDFEAFQRAGRGEDESSQMVPIDITPETAKFFFSLFHGRVDVYAKRSKNGYYTVCENRWKSELCPKKEGKKAKCAECPNKNWPSLNSTVLMQHMAGKREDCGDVVGVYVMLKDDTCRFIVFDFDNHNEELEASKGWQDEVEALRRICSLCNIDCLVERSRSGKGAHVWIFFSDPVPALKARMFGNALVTKGAELVSMKNFLYYDRMLPMQDYLSENGLGNLIALPWQGQAMKKGNSLFVDEHWQPLKDQYKALTQVHKLSLQRVEACIKEWCPDNNPYGQLQEDDGNEPKERELFSDRQIFHYSDASDKIRIILENGLYICKKGLKPRLQNALRRLAAYSNPEFYKNLNRGISTRDMPRIVYCGYDDGDYIVLPRGLQTSLTDALADAGIQYDLIDRRQPGRKIDVRFIGELYPEQTDAVENLSAYDDGVLHAATSFGKTVVGAYLIAQRKVNTLVLVHNVEIMSGWVKALEQFLQIDEPLPTYTTPGGRVKHRASCLGTFSSQKNALSGIVDVAMITSLGRDDEINPIVRNYGMVIMDECHHAAAYTCESVLRALTAKYVYGFTANTKRGDGQDKKIFMQLGAVRHMYTALERADKQGIGHYVYPRFTRVVDVSEKLTISDAFSLVAGNGMRNLQIVTDAVECVKMGRTPIVMTKRKEHAAKLYEMLRGAAQNVFLLQGGSSLKDREILRNQMAAVPKDETMLAVAIGQYVGEGFNYPRLDTLLLAMPISFESNVEQYAGRLNRDYEGKKDVIIFDYIDQYVPMLERMYHKRLRTYKRIGFEICSQVADRQVVENSIFDWQNYLDVFDCDLASAKSEVVISSPGLGTRKVWKFIREVTPLQERGVRIAVLTLSPSAFSDDEAGKHQEELTGALQSVGITVRCSEKCREHFAVVDNVIVWYGSMNLLSREKEEDSMMRLENSSIAQELLLKWTE